MKELDALCEEIAHRGAAPNAAAGFARRVNGVWRFATGGDAGALFDLASVTKSIFAVAFARSGIDRQARLGDRVEAARGTPSADTPIELLLAHRAGLASHLPLYEPLAHGARVDVNAALRAASSSRDAANGPLPALPVYSDLGYLLAGYFAGDVDALVGEHVIGPLGLERELGSARALGRLGVDLPALAPPTEIVAWRGGEVRGHVHDENAWALGGDTACGHAGLFGSVGAVLRFGASVLDDVRPLQLGGGELEWLVRERPGGTLRAGFDGKSPEGSSAGVVLGPRSFGHLGFTGTSLWIDPDAELCVALLTNRVHPSRDDSARPWRIREARPWAHDRIARLALAAPISSSGRRGP